VRKRRDKWTNMINEQTCFYAIIHWEMIFWQPLFDNFWTTFSFILTWCCYPLSSFFSLHCFWPIKSARNKVVNKVVIKWMSKYHYSYTFVFFQFPVYIDTWRRSIGFLTLQISLACVGLGMVHLLTLKDKKGKHLIMNVTQKVLAWW
jgi:hypothetical protein